MSGDDFISRWSRRKVQAREGQAGGTRQEAGGTRQEAEGTRREAGGTRQEAGDLAVPSAAVPVETAPLPTIESLTPESDFSPFMRPGVDADTRRLAVKKLFEDPRYNVMDGLDVYIDDYSKADPLPEGWLEKMNQVARLGIFKPAAEEAEKPPEIAAEISEPPPIPLVQGEADVANPPVTSDAPIDASQVGESRPGKV
jgi:hypothetical protein